MDYIGTKQPPVNFKSYEWLGKETRAYYDMNPYPYWAFASWRTGNNGPLPKCLPIVRNIVDKSARWLFGKDIDIVCDNDTIKTAIDDVLDKNKIHSRLVNLAKLGGIEGGVALKYNVVNNEVRIQTLSPVNEVKFYVNPHDKYEVLMVRIEYPFFDGENWYFYREEWTKDLYVVYKPLKAQMLSARKENPYYYTQTPYSDTFSDKWEVKSSETNKFGVIPVVLLKNMEDDSEYGKGDLFYLTRTVDRINLVYHLMDRSNQLDSDPVKVFIDADIDQDEMPHGTDAGDILSLKSDESENGEIKKADVKLLETKGLLRGPMEMYAKDMKNLLYEATGSVFSRPEDITNKGNLTQSVLVQLYAPMIEVVSEKRKTYGQEGIVRFLYVMCEGLKKAGVGDFKAFPDKCKIDIKWPDFFRLSSDEKFSEFDRLSREVESGLITRKAAIEKIAELENIENVKELVSELEDWEPMEMQLAKINSTTSQGDYENGNEKGNSSRQQKRGKRVKDLQ